MFLGHPAPSQLVACAIGNNVQIIPAPSLPVAINGRPFSELWNGGCVSVRWFRIA